jgi:hypothetical protein
MKEIPKDYKLLSYGTIAIMNKDNNEIVVIISFSPFKKCQKKNMKNLKILSRHFGK